MLFLLLGIFFFVGAIVPAGHRPPEDRWAKLSRSDIAILDPDRPDAALLTLNALTGSLVEVAEGLLTAQTHAAGWISCYCRRGPAEPYQSLVIPVAQADRAIRLEPGDPPPRLALFPARRVLTYLDRLKIEGAERPVPADGAYRLRLAGWDAAGAPIEPLAVRWSSRDTTVATIDSMGALRPRREGRVMVTATAGGWRTASVEVRLGPAEATTVAVEDWRESLAPSWVPFGEPQPITVPTERGTALAPNGDSTNLSGVYLRRRLPTAGGIGVEFDLSTPLTSLVWQHVHVWLVSADSLDVSRWDHRAGILPLPDDGWRACGVHFPASESHSGRQSVLLSGGVGRLVAAPPAMASGRWTRMRLQFFPDGRCGIAVEGQARAILDRHVPLGDSAMLLIHSYSHRTRILAGHLEVWTGVRRDVDWDAVQRD